MNRVASALLFFLALISLLAFGCVSREQPPQTPPGLRGVQQTASPSAPASPTPTPTPSPAVGNGEFSLPTGEDTGEPELEDLGEDFSELVG